MPDSYYDLLGVDQQASTAEIRQAYRQRAKELHPDHSDAPNARAQFVELQRAKEVLTDVHHRQQYDRQLHRNAHHRPSAGAGTSTGTSSGSTANPAEDIDWEPWNWKRDQETSSSSSSSYSNANPYGHQRGQEARYGHGHRPRPSWTLQALRKITASPTLLPLVATITMYLSAMRLAPVLGIRLETAPALSLAFVVGSLVVSYLSYEFVLPRHLDSPGSTLFTPSFSSAGSSGDRGDERSGTNDDTATDDSTTWGHPYSFSFWSIIAANLIGLGLLIIAAARSGLSSGLLFALTSTIYTGGIFLASTAFFAIAAKLLLDPCWIAAILAGASPFSRMEEPDFVTASLHALGLGALLGTGTTLGVLFTSAWSVSLRGILSRTIGAGMTTPWLDPRTIWAVQVGSLANVVLSFTMLGCLLWSVLAVYRRLPAALWRDRFEHEYRIHPGIWNAAVMAPGVVLVWMTVSGIGAVAVSLPLMQPRGVWISRGLLWFMIGILPALATSAYLARRRAEPFLHGDSEDHSGDTDRDSAHTHS